MNIEKLVSILENNFNNFQGSFVNKGKNYENEVAEIVGFDFVNKIFHDIEKDLFTVEVKKQQNAQWVDVLKVSEIMVEKNDSILDSYILFLYYKKNEDTINTMALMTYRQLAELLNLNEEKALIYYAVKQLGEKEQCKRSISKKKVLEKAGIVITEESSEEKFWSEHSVCQHCGNIYENTNTDMVCNDCLTIKE